MVTADQRKLLEVLQDACVAGLVGVLRRVSSATETDTASLMGSSTVPEGSREVSVGNQQGCRVPGPVPGLPAEGAGVSGCCERGGHQSKCLSRQGWKLPLAKVFPWKCFGAGKTKSFFRIAANSSQMSGRLAWQEG